MKDGVCMWHKSVESCPDLTAWALHPNGIWASPISGEKEVDPRISDFLIENDGDPLDPYVLGQLLLGDGRWGRTEINAA